MKRTPTWSRIQGETDHITPLGAAKLAWSQNGADIEVQLPAALPDKDAYMPWMEPVS